MFPSEPIDLSSLSNLPARVLVVAYDPTTSLNSVSILLRTFGNTHTHLGSPFAANLAVTVTMASDAVNKMFTKAVNGIANTFNDLAEDDYIGLNQCIARAHALLRYHRIQCYFQLANMSPIFPFMFA